MTIEVVSAEKPVAQAEANAQEGTGAKSEPVAEKAAEQKEPEKADASGKEDAEESEENEDESEDSESTDESEAKDDKPKKKSGSQRRKERAERAEAEAARWREQAEHWKAMAFKGAGDKKEPDKTEVKPAAADEEPQPENFETHREFVKALAKWELKQELKELDQKSEKKRLEVEQTNLVKSYSEREKLFAKKVDDFNEVLAEVEDIPLSPALREIILTSENGPELAYELAKNRDELARVCKLSPLSVAREVGKLEASLAAKAAASKEPETKKITKAPKPIDPVGAGGKGGSTKSPDDMSQSEYEAWRREQMKRNAG